MKIINVILKSLFLSVIILSTVAVFTGSSQCAAPSAKISPSHLKIIKGDSLRIEPTITGTTPIDFQWYFLGAGTIKGATKPNYTIQKVMRADTIYLRVMNKCGQQFSNPVYIELDTITPSSQKPKVVPKPKATTVKPKATSTVKPKTTTQPKAKN